MTELAENLAEYHDDEEKELAEHNTMLAKCNFKLTERLAEYYNDDLDRELVESNAKVANCNLKLADSLIEYHDEEKTKGVNILL